MMHGQQNIKYVFIYFGQSEIRPCGVKFVNTAPTLIVSISGKFTAYRLSSVPNAEAMPWRPANLAVIARFKFL
jgi:hypothetical protein